MTRRTLATMLLAASLGRYLQSSFQCRSEAQANKAKSDESKLAVLAGNTRPEANEANDRGAVPGNLAEPVI